MQRTVVVLVLLVVATILAPAIAYAQELLPTPEMAAPLGLLTFGLLGLVGGVAGYVRRHRSTR